MLKPVLGKSVRRSDASFAIVASKYNAQYVDSMLNAARAELTRAGAKQIQVVRVPGAYEIPLIAAEFASARSAGAPAPDAIICLGVILRGETVHAAHIGEAVSRALMQIQIQHGVPVIHEVLLLENKQQAEARCLDKRHNRGTEAAQTALAMAETIRELRTRGQPSRGIPV